MNAMLLKVLTVLSLTVSKNCQKNIHEYSDGLAKETYICNTFIQVFSNVWINLRFLQLQLFNYFWDFFNYNYLVQMKPVVLTWDSDKI